MLFRSDKTRIETPVVVTRDGLAGDVQADRANHGGPDKAVCAYALAHYAFWRDQLSLSVLPPTGAFGENLTIAELVDQDVCIGDVYRLGERRAIAGRIDSGTLSVGDEISFWPGGVAARVASFEEWGRATPRTSAEAGRSVAIVLDREIVAERGMIVSKSASAPTQTTTIATQIFWFAPEPLEVGRTLKLRLGTATHDVVVTAIDHVVDVNDLSQSSAQRIERNGVGRVVLRSGRPMVVDRYADHPRGGRGEIGRAHV